MNLGAAKFSKDSSQKGYFTRILFASMISNLLVIDSLILKIIYVLLAVSPTDFVYEWYWKTPTNNLISYGKLLDLNFVGHRYLVKFSENRQIEK